MGFTKALMARSSQTSYPTAGRIRMTRRSRARTNLVDSLWLQPCWGYGIPRHGGEARGVEVHGQGGLDPDVGDVMNVVRPEGPPLAGDQRPVCAPVALCGLFQQGAADSEESTRGLAMVMPSGVGPCGPGVEPDLEIGTGVELDPNDALLIDDPPGRAAPGQRRTGGRCAAAGRG